MKKISALLILLLSVWACSKSTPEQTFSYSPEKPEAGDQLEIVYYPAGKNLVNTKVTAAVYFYYNEAPVVIDQLMDEDGGVFTTSLKVPEGFRGALVKFEYGDEVDNNDGLGYLVRLANSDGVIYPDIDAATVFAKTTWGKRYLDLKSDNDNALRFVSEEFQKGNANKQDYFQAYFGLLRQTEANQAKIVIDDEIGIALRDGNLTQHQIEAILTYNERYELGRDLSALVAQLKEMDPQNAYFYSADAKLLENAESVESVISEVDALLAKYKSDEAKKRIHNIATSKIYTMRQFDELKKYIDKYPDAASGGLLNAVAWNLAEQGENLDLADGFAQQGIDVYLNEINTLKSKPDMVTSREYIEGQKYSLGMVYDTYAYILELKGEMPQALAAYGKAVENLDSEDPGVNERYVQALVATGDFQLAFDKISRFIKEGKATPIMTDLLKQSYVKVKGSSEGMDEYISGIEGEATAKMKEKLKKEILNEAAPAFTLRNLEGEEVSLSDYTGKTVVVDFWATWCGPCRQSFPGMKTAVEKHDDVQFLFVNAWQNEKELDSFETKRKNAADFITKNNYPFDVLIDVENKVISSFNVSGIPTKFIIDKNGNIRFKSVGYGGNPDELVAELGLMFEMIN